MKANPIKLTLLAIASTILFVACKHEVPPKSCEAIGFKISVTKTDVLLNGSCVTGTLKKMPISPQPNLTTAEKQLITNWVNAGHRYTD